jgi:hypothetical protein
MIQFCHVFVSIVAELRILKSGAVSPNAALSIVGWMHGRGIRYLRNLAMSAAGARRRRHPGMPKPQKRSMKIAQLHLQLARKP